MCSSEDCCFNLASASRSMMLLDKVSTGLFGTQPLCVTFDSALAFTRLRSIRPGIFGIPAGSSNWLCGLGSKATFEDTSLSLLVVPDILSWGPSFLDWIAGDSPCWVFLAVKRA